MPDHGEAKYRREGGDNNTGTTIFRHMNLFILSVLLVRFAFSSFPRRRHVRERAAQRQSYRTVAETKLTTPAYGHPMGRRLIAVSIAVAQPETKIRNQLAQDTQRNQRGHRRRQPSASYGTADQFAG